MCFDFCCFHLATTNGVRWHGRVLRRDDDSVLRVAYDSVLRVALDLEVSGKRKQGSKRRPERSKWERRQ